MASPVVEIYDKEEKVLAHHQNMIYEAKVLNVEERPDPVKLGYRKQYYQIHYQGWNDRWDEWVDESRLLKYNDENRALQAKIRMEGKKLGKRKDRKDGSGKSIKKRRDLTPGGNEKEPSLIKVEINIPQPLKMKLIHDWEHVINQKHLVPLPRNPNVSQLLQSYLNSKQNNSGKGEYDAVVEGIKAYFDKSLGTELLYKFERQQYSDVLGNVNNQGKRMSDIYGIEHLLRLFVKLPDLIATVEMEEEAVAILTQGVKDILKYVTSNTATLFVQEYLIPTPVYLRMSTF